MCNVPALSFRKYVFARIVSLAISWANINVYRQHCWFCHFGAAFKATQVASNKFYNMMSKETLKGGELAKW